MAERYSTLPWPRGCFVSGFLPASHVPKIVTTEESASLRLFTASNITAMEFESRPTAALKPAKNRFAKMPITLVRTITLPRSAATAAGDPGSPPVFFSFVSLLMGMPPFDCLQLNCISNKDSCQGEYESFRGAFTEKKPPERVSRSGGDGCFCVYFRF